MKRTAVCIFITLVSAIAFPFQAQADAGGENHCLTPFGGAQDGELIDLNEVTGRTEAFVHPRYCPTVEAGERWILGRGCIAFWAVSPGPARYPRGYVPQGATPMDDFLSKATIKVVVDPGTTHERVYLHRYESDNNAVIIWHWSDFGSGRSPFGDEKNLIIGLIPANPPQPIGTHTVDLYLQMSADHWDGIGTNPNRNVLRAGEMLVIGGNAFETVPNS